MMGSNQLQEKHLLIWCYKEDPVSHICAKFYNNRTCTELCGRMWPSLAAMTEKVNSLRIHQFLCVCVYIYNFVFFSIVLQDHCAKTPCENGGTCTNVPFYNTYHCMCPVEYTGHDCEIGKYWWSKILKNIGSYLFHKKIMIDLGPVAHPLPQLNPNTENNRQQ